MSISILNLALAAKYFGVSKDRDIWLLAFNFVTVLNLALLGPVDEVFRPKFLFMKQEEGEKMAICRTNSLLSVSTLLSIAIVVLILIFPVPISKLIAPSYSGVELQNLALMMQIAAPIFLFTQLTKIWTSVLNAYEVFYVPEIAGTISAVLNVVLLLLLARKIGIYSLAVSTYIGLFLLGILLVIQIRKQRIAIWGFSFSVVRDGKMAWPFIVYSLPFFIPYFTGQLSTMLEKTLASLLGDGKVSMLDYSRKFTDISVGVLTSVLATVMVPVLSKCFLEKNEKEFARQLEQTSSTGIIILTLVIAFLTACPGAVVDFLYNKGDISGVDLWNITRLTTCYAWSSLGIFLYLITGLALMSAGKSVVYASCSVMAQVITIIVNLALFKFADVYIFPLSLLISHLIMGVYMFRKLPIEKNDLLKTLLRYFAMLGFVTAMLYIFNNVISMEISSVWRIFINGISLLILLVISVFIFRLNERSMIEKAVQKLFRQ